MSSNLTSSAVKYLGIDYGAKRIGIALSDGSGSLAFPKAVIRSGDFPGEAELAREVARIAAEEKAEGIVIGESRDYKNAANPIMRKIEGFKAALEAASGLPVSYEPEFMTSAMAEHLQGKTAMHDASAAAMILQSFLDKSRPGA